MTPPRASTAYPLVLTALSGVRCVVVGGGTVAERKTEQVIEAGAKPQLISPQLSPLLAAWRDGDRLVHQARPYRPGDLDGAFLAIAATDDASVNAEVAAEARARNLLVNIADAPHLGNFHTVASVRRGDLLLSVSTGGASPSLAMHVKHELEGRFGPEYALLLALMRGLREGKARSLGRAARRTLWRALLSPWVRDALAKGEHAAVQRYLDRHFGTLPDGPRPPLEELDDASRDAA